MSYYVFKVNSDSVDFIITVSYFFSAKRSDSYYDFGIISCNLIFIKEFWFNNFDFDFSNGDTSLSVDQ